jgi:DNA-binding IclR family transcriptional regulator
MKTDTKVAKPAPSTKAVKSASANPDGTQAIRRAASILKAIAKANSQGISLADISRTEELPRSTAHRILKCLVDEGFVEYAGDSRRYQMGGLTYELGLAVSKGVLEVARWRDVIDAVARRTGVTSYLMRRSGVEAVCLIKAEGTSVVRVIPVEVGQRRLLGVGAGATALLAALDDATADRIIETITPGLKNHPQISADTLRAAVQNTRSTGFATSEGRVVAESFGLGAIVPDAKGTPSLAISIAAHVSLVNDANINKWKRILREEIQAATGLSKSA